MKTHIWIFLDDNSSGRASTRGSIRRPEGHLTAAHFARSCSLGVPRASSTNPSSLGQESGFQSCTSLNSLGGGHQHQHQQQQHQQQQQRTSLRGRREQIPLTSQPATGLLGNQVCKLKFFCYFIGKKLFVKLMESMLLEATEFKLKYRFTSLQCFNFLAKRC